MAADSNVAPVIIKRKKVVQGGGHHGGAWKVAYADFVTAMMAFFMLMWLLNATTEKQRKGIADYFSPTIAISRVSGGGNGMLSGHSVFSEETLPRMGQGATSLHATSDKSTSGANGNESDAEEEKFKALETALMGRGGESMVADELLEHIVTKVTDEGLVIEFYETADSFLFDADNEPTLLLQQLAGLIADVAALVTNDIAIEGHVSAFPVVRASDPAWSVSSQRADTMRRVVTSAGMDPVRINRVTAHGDRERAIEEPMNPRNNRIEVIFLREL